ncbi:TonB-dependent siderophore receptor [Sphingomonas sp. ID1715]|uniref:TonB-dependent receptor n=1 Tax=Sphingomonas sp. ID1715 TaxID=1656898 RepID=UPI00148888E2|nr:TonB-dependent siderophore receptor [Sphingomonas sp. ID1715]NNM78538.1 TonB-dependent siderophore receptor [Sphingomonas sp. ID1715]
MNVRICAGAAILVACNGVALAEGVAEDAASADPTIVVSGLHMDAYSVRDSSAAKIDAPLRDIPQTIDVVPSAVLRDQRALSVQDALKNVPGVGFSTGDGQRDQVTIRGFSAIADQFVDGFRDDALYFRDLSNIDRIEVIKGPAAVLYGRGSSGGLINRVTRKPGIDILSATLTAGSQAVKRGEFDLGQASQGGDFAWRMTGAIERSGSYRDQQFLHRLAIAPAFRFAPDADTLLLVQADYLKDRRLTDFGIPAFQGRPVDVDRSTYYGAANAREADYNQSEVFSQTVTLTHRFSDSLSFRNGFRHYRYTLDRRNTLPGSVNEARRTVTLNRSTVARDEDGWSNQSELTQTLELFGTHHTILYGFEVARQVKDVLVQSRNAIATVDLFQPVLPVVPVSLAVNPSSNNTGVFDNKALYLQDLVAFGGGFKALLSVRHDWFDQRTVQRIAGQPSLSRKDREWSPRAGLVFQPDGTQSYYASWSRSFQPSGEAFSIAVNNADIKPETTTNKEVGAKYTLLDGHLNLTLSAFELRRTGIKAASPATPTVLIPIGTQRTRGVELTGALDFATGWRAIAGYSYLDGRITRSIAFDAGQPIAGKRPTLTPKHSANLFVTKSFGDRFGLGMGTNYVGDRFANPGNTVVLPGYVTADALAWYQAGPVRLQVNAYNLFNRNYIVSAHGTSPNLNLPGAPRQILFTARFAM